MLSTESACAHSQKRDDDDDDKDGAYWDIDPTMIVVVHDFTYPFTY